MFNGEPGSASAGASRNVVRSSSISGEICGSQQAGGGAGTSTAKKRRSSLGAKMVAIVGLTQWSKSTLQLPQPGEGCGHKEMGKVGEEGHVLLLRPQRRRGGAHSAGAVWASVCAMLWSSLAGSNHPERKSQVLQTAQHRVVESGLKAQLPFLVSASTYRRVHL